MSEPVVLYEERGSVAIVTLNRPGKMNTLTEGVVQGVADSIDRATASRPVRSIVLRGAGRALTGGYDLNPGRGAEIEDGWGSPYDAPGPKPRAGAWDPVRDLQFMGNNVKRFMKIWECPKARTRPRFARLSRGRDRGDDRSARAATREHPGEPVGLEQALDQPDLREHGPADDPVARDFLRRRDPSHGRSLSMGREFFGEGLSRGDPGAGCAAR